MTSILMTHIQLERKSTVFMNEVFIGKPTDECTLLVLIFELLHCRVAT